VLLVALGIGLLLVKDEDAYHRTSLVVDARA
jgi:hypothetical protein